jgi:hypothetical protein
MKPLKSNQEGISHYLLPVLFVVIIAFIGMRVLTMSHAATTGVATSTLSSENGMRAPKGFPVTTLSGGVLQNQLSTGGSGVLISGAYFYYASMAEGSITANGASVTLSQSKPIVGVTDYHSLSELAIQSADGRQIIEIGWIVAPPMFHDSLTHLFVFHWVNSIPTCYNGCGFVPTSKTYHAGELLQVGVTGTYAIQYKTNQWQLSYNGTPIGYFPVTIWKGSFTQLGLVKVFGEVASSSATTPHTQMGNGVLGTNSKSAFIKNLTLIGSRGSNSLSYNANNAPAVYNIGNFNRICVTACGMNFGGPGY